MRFKTRIGDNDGGGQKVERPLTKRYFAPEKKKRVKERKREERRTSGSALQNAVLQKRVRGHARAIATRATGRYVRVEQGACHALGNFGRQVTHV